jgi:hypothetical protein
LRVAAAGLCELVLAAVAVLTWRLPRFHSGLTG